MQTEQLIRIDSFCAGHNVTFSFVHSLHEYGLIELTSREDMVFIEEGALERLEKLVRLHHDLDINIEGVEAVIHLLQKLKEQQDEIILLRNKLHFYES